LTILLIFPKRKLYFGKYRKYAPDATFMLANIAKIWTAKPLFCSKKRDF